MQTSIQNEEKGAQCGTCSGGVCPPECNDASEKSEEAKTEDGSGMQDEYALAVLIALVPALTMTLFNVMGLL